MSLRLVLGFAFLKDSFASPCLSCFTDKSLNTCQVLHGTVSFLFQWCTRLASLFAIKSSCCFSFYHHLVQKDGTASQSYWSFYTVVCNEVSLSETAKVCVAILLTHSVVRRTWADCSLWSINLIQARRNKMVLFHAKLFLVFKYWSVEVLYLHVFKYLLLMEQYGLVWTKEFCLCLLFLNCFQCNVVLKSFRINLLLFILFQSFWNFGIKIG